MAEPVAEPPSLHARQVFGSFNAFCALAFAAYCVYVLSFVFGRRSCHSWHILRHVASGVLTMAVGPYAVATLLFGRRMEPWALHCWSACYLHNTLTGFFLIRKLDNADPSVRREFIALTMVQLIFLPATYSLVCPFLAGYLLPVLLALLAFGLVATIANTSMCVSDWKGSRSRMIKPPVIDWENENYAHSTLWEDYVKVLFIRGSPETRIPADCQTICHALLLVVPFVVILLLVPRAELLRSHTVMDDEYAWYILLLFGTVGSAQIFHGTVAVHGRESLQRVSSMVFATVVLELLSLVTFPLARHPPAECAAFARACFAV